MNPSAQSLAKGLCEGRVKADDLVNVSLNTPHSAIDCLVTWCDEVSLEVSRPICALASRARIAAVAARTPDLGLRLGSSPLPLIFGGIFDMKRLVTLSTLMALIVLSVSSTGVTHAATPTFTTLQPGQFREINQNLKVNIVLVGYHQGAGPRDP